MTGVDARRPRASALRLALPVLLLLVAGVSGLRNGANEYRQAVTAGQQFATASEIAHGAVSWIALYGLLRRRAWARRMMLLWAALLTITAGSAAAAWGDAGPWGALAGGASVAAVCALVLWLAFPRSRPASIAQTRLPGSLEKEGFQ